MSDFCVLKFGGTSVGDSRAFERVLGILRRRSGAPSMVVVSAMSGTTDALISAVRAARLDDDVSAATSLEPTFARHRKVAAKLLDPERKTAFEEVLMQRRQEVRELLERVAHGGGDLAALEDEIVARGELMSSALLTAVLDAGGVASAWVDSRRVVATDGAHGKARPFLSVTERQAMAICRPLLDEGLVPVLGGFIASNEKGETTTVGRGGSDYTAALLGASMQADEIQIWTDVPGVLTADPRVVKTARTVAHLSYAEAAELAYFGAKVLHPETIRPARERDVPVRILSTFEPEAPGTLVSAETTEADGAVKAIAHRGGSVVIQITSGRMLGAHGFLRALFEVFERHQTVIDVVSTSEVSVSLTIENDGAIDAIEQELAQLGRVTVERERAVICVVGEGLRATPGIAGRVFHAIPDINVSLISLGASQLNLTFVVDGDQVQETVATLHHTLLDEDFPEITAVEAL